MRVLTNGKQNTTQALETIHEMIAQGAGGEHVEVFACRLCGRERTWE